METYFTRCSLLAVMIILIKVFEVLALALEAVCGDIRLIKEQL